MLIIPLYITLHLIIPNSQSSPPHTPAKLQPHALALFGLDEPSYPQLLRKSPDTYQKREIKPRSMPGLDIEEGVAVSAQADWFVSLTPPDSKQLPQRLSRRHRK